MSGNLRQLPKLKVLRETYCDQETTDKALSFLQANNPELVEEFLLEENSRTYDCFNVAFHILDYLAEHGGTEFSVPATSLGKMDLVCELARRLRKAYDRVDTPPRGKPIAESPDKMPPLAVTALDKDSKRRGSLTQEITDHVLWIAYQSRPDIWFATSEEYRNVMCLEATEQFRALIEDVLQREFPGATSTWTSGELFLEGIRRIYKMCDINT